MSIELLLQILVFPALAVIYADVAAIKARLAAGDVKLKDLERRVEKLEETA